MATIKVHAGNLDKGSWNFVGMFGATMTRASTEKHLFKGESYVFGQDIVRVEQLDEDKVKLLSGTAGWGLAGAALLGPLGAIGGILLGGNKREIVFAAYLEDGRKFMATTDRSVWKKISVAMF